MVGIAKVYTRGIREWGFSGSNGMIGRYAVFHWVMTVGVGESDNDRGGIWSYFEGVDDVGVDMT